MTFDLERARGLRDFLQDDCAEVGDVWAEMIAEIERLRAIIDTPSEEPEWAVDFKKLNRFAGVGYSLIDIEIAKKWHTAYRKAQNSNLLRKQEIERLRASLIDLHAEYINTLEKNPGCSAWDLDEQSDADQKRLRRNAAHAISIVEPPIYLQAEQRATKIKELEPKCDHAWQAAIEERGYQTCLKCGECRNIEDIPRTAPAWQITEERKAAIKELSELLTAIGCPSCHYYIQKNYGEDITVLRAMLTGADHDKP